MGSFNITCPISNIPIKVRDKVKFSIIVKNTSCLYSTGYVTGSFHFLFPLINAEYNDYGFVENIKSNWFDIVESNIKNKFGNTCEEIANLEKEDVKLWMVRADVFDYIVKNVPDDKKYVYNNKKLKKEVELYINSYNSYCDSDLYREVVGIGLTGGFLNRRKDILETVIKSDNRDDFSKMLLKSIKFIRGLHWLGKKVEPIHFVQPPYNLSPNEDLIRFNKFSISILEDIINENN